MILLKVRFIFFLLLFVLFPTSGFSSDLIKTQGTNGSSEITLDLLIQIGEPLFIHYCSHCHGINGDGEGFNAEYLDREPANLTDPEFMAKRKDSRIYRVINKGGPEVRKSNLMPAFGNTLSDLEIWSLVAYVRSLSEGDLKDFPDDLNPERPKRSKFTKRELADFITWVKSGGLDEASEEGELLVNNKKSCPACHAIEDEGGALGPDLTRAGLLYSPEWLFRWLNNPQEFKPNTKMPNHGLSVEEIKAITSFLMGLTGEEEELIKFTVKGNSEKGKKLFFDLDGKAKCAKCHKVNQNGGEIGPDLSFVGTSRTKEFLAESILEPSKVLTSGFATVSVLSKDGKFFNGVQKKLKKDSFDLVDAAGKVSSIKQDRINKFKFADKSLMPDNFKTVLSEQEVADILSYLKTLNLSNSKLK